jgi:adenosylcobinamide-GDP ribazoletransferase
MIAQWRLFLTALRYFTRIPVPASVLLGSPSFDSAARFLPLVGCVVGAGAGLVYWGATQIWPTSLAVILAILAGVLMTGALHEQGLAAACGLLGNALPQARQWSKDDVTRRSGFGALGLLLLLMIKYNALMALSAANLSIGLPANMGLGLIMIAAGASSRALVVSVIATPPGVDKPPSTVKAPSISGGELGFALLSGFIPAILMGLPGLIGLAAAIIVRFAFVHGVRDHLSVQPGDFLGATQQLAEIAFYLGSLGAWTYI